MTDPAQDPQQAIDDGQGLLADGVAPERNPAAQVADRASDIRITQSAHLLRQPGGLPADRDQPRHRRLGRPQGRRSAAGQGAGRVAVRAARRREPDAHRAPVAEDVPGAPQHARRGAHGPHHRRPGHGPVGHHRQAARRAGLPPARRATAATASASTTRRRPARCRRPASTSIPPTPPTSTAWWPPSRRPASRSAPTGPSCSTPTAPCRRPR